MAKERTVAPGNQPHKRRLIFHQNLSNLFEQQSSYFLSICRSSSRETLSKKKNSYQKPDSKQAERSKLPYLKKIRYNKKINDVNMKVCTGITLHAENNLLNPQPHANGHMLTYMLRASRGTLIYIVSSCANSVRRARSSQILIPE